MDLNLPLLQGHRHFSRLPFLYKVVEGKVPALPDEFLKPVRHRGHIKARQFLVFHAKI